jgi:hypothetical protein
MTGPLGPEITTRPFDWARDAREDVGVRIFPAIVADPHAQGPLGGRGIPLAIGTFFNALRADG